MKGKIGNEKVNSNSCILNQFYLYIVYISLIKLSLLRMFSYVYVISNIKDYVGSCKNYQVCYLKLT